MEEFPAEFVKPALAELTDLSKQFFSDHRLAYASIQSMGTLRRLVLLVEQLAAYQTPRSSRVLGPPKSAAFDAEGRPTSAAKGFARAQGVSVDDLQVEETPKGLYVCAVKHERGQPTQHVLRQHLAGMIQRLGFPKSMRWNASRLRFARPLRWIVALYGSRPIRFELGGVVAGARTRGHRFFRAARPSRPMTVEVKSPTSYRALMKRVGVVVDPREREAMIQQQLADLAKQAQGRVLAAPADQLLEQAVYSVEWPRAILGQFETIFLHLPQDVLITSMREHQGYFSLIGQDQRLLPRFIAVTNVRSPKIDLVRKGHERVLTARLKDAQYFFQEDRKVRLEDRVERLRGIVFHQKLGSLYEKTMRVKALATLIADMLGRLDLKEWCERAAYLAKADLTTGMVGEFPSLQGIMGREYARAEGEPEEICRALADHYEPRTPDGPLPDSPVGMILGLADRLDTVTAFFHVGIIPSGSEDPFGLRRAAYGIVRLVCERNLSLNLIPLIHAARQALEGQGYASRSSTIDIGQAILGFLLDRLRFYARSVRGIREDVVEAVLALDCSVTCDLADLLARMVALHAIADQPEFERLLIGFKRAHRIVQKEHWTEHAIHPELFEHETERLLFHALDEAQRRMATALERREYSDALAILLDLKEPIDRFFDGVMVNAADPAIRANRLSLLAKVDELFRRVADFSLLQE